MSNLTNVFTKNAKHWANNFAGIISWSRSRCSSSSSPLASNTPVRAHLLFFGFLLRSGFVHFAHGGGWHSSLGERTPRVHSSRFSSGHAPLQGHGLAAAVGLLPQSSATSRRAWPNPSVKASPNSCARKARLGQSYHRPSRGLTRSAVGPALPRTLGHQQNQHSAMRQVRDD